MKSENLPRRLDPQQIELIGRSLLVSELLRDGIEVALPERDRGIDLIAYIDLDDANSTFVARPIQLKASTRPGFSIDAKYERFPDLLLAHLWNVDRATELQAFCMTYAEAHVVAKAMGWTETRSFTEGGVYRASPPSARLMVLLEPHRMAPGRWRAKISALSP